MSLRFSSRCLVIACAALAMGCGDQSTVDRLPNGGTVTINSTSYEFVRLSAASPGTGCAGLTAARLAGETITKNIEVYTFDSTGRPIGLMDISVTAPFMANTTTGTFTVAILDNGVDVTTATDPSPYETTTDAFGIKRLTLEFDISRQDDCDYFGQLEVSSGTQSAQMDFLIHDDGDGVGGGP